MTITDLAHLVQNYLEKLRILAAEADGWTEIAYRRHPEENKLYNDEPDYLWFGVNPEKTGVRKLADYTTSLDAIFSAEERLGIHGGKLQGVWCCVVEQLLGFLGISDCRTSFAFLTPAIRTAAFIETAEWKKNNKI